MNELITTDQHAVLQTTVELDRNPAAVYLASLAPGSRRAMRQALDTIARMLGAPDALAVEWQRLRFQHTAAVRSQLAERYSAASANKALSALRGVLRAAFKLGLLGADDYERARQVESVRGQNLPRGRALSAGEIAALMGACADDPSAAGARDASMLAVLRAGGLRRAELIALDVADYDATDGSVRVRGKGNKVRLAYIANGARDALADWLQLRGAQDGPLFNPVSRIGEIQHGERLSTQAVYNLLAKRAEQAGVRNLSPHDLRRTFVSDLLDAGADISTVQKLAGHANVTTTQRYDRRGEVAKQRASQLLHVPYTRRSA